MQTKYLIAACLIVVILGLLTALYPETGASILIVAALSVLAISVFRRFTDDKDFVTSIFLIALVVRLIFGLFVHIYDLREFFGGDALTYDYNGSNLAAYWWGTIGINDPVMDKVMRMSSSGWGMYYLVAAIYSIFGKNILAAQSFCAVVGAATAPMVYYCSVKIFQNKSVGKFAAISIALFPSFIIWSGQLMKDGLIIFLLVLAMTMVLQLQEKFNYAALVLLMLSLGGIISLRFYIFYMVAIAVAGSFVIGISKSTQSILARTAVLVAVGLGLTYMGVVRNAEVQFERFGNLETVELTRGDQAASAASGFGDETDVSTTGGAITALPVGFIYLMFAPFPWQVSSFRQAITLPEVLLWWAMIPVMMMGIWYAIKHQMRRAFPILIFSLMLTLAYSIFQGNVGTAYRQRTQIQVFLFIFIAVGWTIYKERLEDKKLLRTNKRKAFERSLQARRLAG
ncbi:MAG: glycosyltransferase family 39 protein [Saprospiraceae bacterium]|nr:glycosyltransferase family 39 protein [Pyrinomonadaceae bacterium]